MKSKLIYSLMLLAGLNLMSLASAQTPAPAAGATPAIPPTWAQGRTADGMNPSLSPNPPGISALPADEIPVSKLKVPPGFKVELWASGMPNGRSMTESPSGVVYVGTRFTGNVYAVVTKDGKREVKTIAKGLHRPNGVAFANGSLYVAELSRIIRYDNIEANLDNPPAPVVVFDALPKDEPHGWKFLTLSPDGQYLYFQIGTPANIVVPPYTHAAIVRLNLKTNILEYVATGVRNSVGMDFQKGTKELWFTNNGRDWADENLPNDTLNRLAHKGMNFGYPFCHQGDFLDPEFGKGRSCDEFDKPEMKLGAHVAALGMRFYNGNMFPAEYKGNIFIAEHGSWNKTKKSGYQVVRVVLDAKNKPVKLEPFITGWLEGESFWGRPVDVQVLKDGSMLVSDDETGAIFRVSYNKK
ncbi:sorbosone dehydrogenase family protein [Polynucleobacter sp. MWH-P3-07-1]|jgi:glucose/arabinose dehydrogenase|uniref:PQQ-dependent sugar dehydrogenase n=1 Tax=Polynucleobacter sp. MWH-P3-07-1 TaxID=1743173 RepID=UPI002040C258|nr:PQQ-dependent sugar dehydrogenase [Polynucleobacter sp. MWH-P3-07-1]